MHQCPELQRNNRAWSLQDPWGIFHRWWMNKRFRLFNLPLHFNELFPPLMLPLSDANTNREPAEKKTSTFSTTFNLTVHLLPQRTFRFVFFTFPLSGRPEVMIYAQLQQPSLMQMHKKASFKSCPSSLLLEDSGSSPAFPFPPCSPPFTTALEIKSGASTSVCAHAKTCSTAFRCTFMCKESG